MSFNEWRLFQCVCCSLVSFPNMSIYSRYADTFPKVYNSEKLASRIPGKERIVFHHEFSEPFAVSFFSGIDLGISHSLLGDSRHPRGKLKI